MGTTRKKAALFRVGDWVTFRYGAGDVTAQVIEDRGPLGVNGRRLYRVRLTRDFAEPDSFELPEEELAAASPIGRTPGPADSGAGTNGG
jgi:hypothetical protein